jgi:adenosylcobinamide-phosphate synthase
VEVLLGVAADLLVGDPRWMPHPVRWFGRLVSWLESSWRRCGLPPVWAGACFWMCAVFLAIAAAVLTLAVIPRPWSHAVWIYFLLAARDLDRHALEVVRELRRGDLESARAAVAMIVGRDTAALSEREVLRATFETVAENLSDAVVAPLFYLAVAGPVGMVLYKAVNTLDSMVGYRNERYIEFGRVSARMDDLLSWIPARLTAALVWLTALLPTLDVARSVRVTLRDAHRQPSPNSGYPEAAVAGALGVQLGGLNFYGGVPTLKQTLGDVAQPLHVCLFPRLRVLLYAPTLIMAAVAAGAGLWL